MARRPSSPGRNHEVRNPKIAEVAGSCAGATTPYLPARRPSSPGRNHEVRNPKTAEVAGSCAGATTPYLPARRFSIGSGVTWHADPRPPVVTMRSVTQKSPRSPARVPALQRLGSGWTFFLHTLLVPLNLAFG